MRTAIRAAVALISVCLFMGLTATAQAGPPPLDRTRSDTIVGNWGGAFHYYTLEHPGAGRLITLRLNFSPWHINKEGGIGFNLYAEKGRLAGRASKVKGQPTQLALTVTADFPTTYLVQVHNYYHGFQITYSLEPEGLAEARAEVAPPVAGGTAQQPGRLIDLAQGSVPGLRHGSFDFYEFRHPGDKRIWLKMVYQPDHWIIAPGVGFNVYLGSKLVAQAQPQGGDLHIRRVKLDPDEPTTYLVQVYNYIPEILLTYQLAVTEHPTGP